MEEFIARELRGRRASISAVIDWIASGGGSNFDLDGSELRDEVHKWHAGQQVSLEMSRNYETAVDEFMRVAYEGKIAVYGYLGSEKSRARELVSDDLFENATAIGWYFCPDSILFDCVTSRHHHYFSLCHIDGDRIKKARNTIWNGLVVETAAALKLWPAPERNGDKRRLGRPQRQRNRVIEENATRCRRWL